MRAIYLTSRVREGSDVFLPSKVRGIQLLNINDLSNEMESQNNDRYPLSSQACLYILMAPPRRQRHFLFVS